MAAKAPDDLFDPWTAATANAVGKHEKVVLRENVKARKKIGPKLIEVARNHYIDPKIAADLVQKLGAPKTADVFREKLPVTKQARSGDIGEILATEYAIRKLSYRVPVLRLRYKDGRNMALRGDDVVAFIIDGGAVRFLKAESKSRATLTQTVLTEAGTALDRDNGRPTRHSVILVAERLTEAGEGTTAAQLLSALIDGKIADGDVRHLIFSLCGNPPDALVTAHLTSYAGGIRRHVAALHIDDHGTFVEQLYAALNA